MADLRAVPIGEPKTIGKHEFADVAQSEWRAAKDAYLDVHRRVASLMALIYKPGQVRVLGQVTGATHEAKRLRDDVDRMIVALDEIVRAAHATRDGA